MDGSRSKAFSESSAGWGQAGSAPGTEMPSDDAVATVWMKTAPLGDLDLKSVINDGCLKQDKQRIIIRGYTNQHTTK